VKNKEQYRGSGGQSPPARSNGGVLVGGLGAKPPEAGKLSKFI